MGLEGLRLRLRMRRVVGSVRVEVDELGALDDGDTRAFPYRVIV
jgi:hypothetical protein